MNYRNEKAEPRSPAKTTPLPRSSYMVNDNHTFRIGGSG
jgi:hypothetical protein